MNRAGENGQFPRQPKSFKHSLPSVANRPPPHRPPPEKKKCQVPNQPLLPLSYKVLVLTTFVLDFSTISIRPTIEDRLVHHEWKAVGARVIVSDTRERGWWCWWWWQPNSFLSLERLQEFRVSLQRSPHLHLDSAPAHPGAAVTKQKHGLLNFDFYGLGGLAAEPPLQAPAGRESACDVHT